MACPGSPPTKGRLLLATPPLEDPNFDRTVIYVLEHHDEGALGLVLNRPSPEQLGEPLDAWVELQTEPSQVFSGGPVEPDALIALARTAEPLDEPDEHLRAAERQPRVGGPRGRSAGDDRFDQRTAGLPWLLRVGSGATGGRDRSRRLAGPRP